MNSKQQITHSNSPGDALERVDHSEFASLWLPASGRLYLYIKARLSRGLSHRVDAEDVLQECCMRALRDFHQFEGGGAVEFYYWASALARHALADAARATRRLKRDHGRERRLERSDWSRIGAGTAGPATRLALSEMHQRVADAFLQLSPAERRLIQLRQMEGRGAQQVAELLKMTEAAVHAAYRRALLRWHEIAGERGGAN